jgi:hypothetical protein
LYILYEQSRKSVLFLVHLANALKRKCVMHLKYFVFSNGGHLGLMADLSEAILKEDHPTTIPAKFGSYLSSGSGEEG